MKRLILLVFIIVTLFGCSRTRKISVPEDGMTVIDYGADRRGSYIIKSATNGEYVIVSEPSPDVATEITASLGLTAKTISRFNDPSWKLHTRVV